MFVAQNRRIYIADYYNNRIQAWWPGSAIGETVATGQAPWDVATVSPMADPGHQA
ncbi:MAG: hypothetical protein ACKO55_01220 [Bacteroidota bacterium]